MFNLILKDIFIQKRNFLFGIFYIFIMILAFQQAGSSMFAASVTAFSYILVQSACAYEDKNKSDVLLNSLPLSRGTIVIARYISIFVFAAISTVYYLLLSGIIQVLGLPFQVYAISLEGITGALFALIFINGIYFPIFFKVGYIKSKLVNFVLLFGVFFGESVLMQEMIRHKDKAFIQTILQFLNQQSDLQIAIEAFAVMILLLIVSYMFSLQNYRKREF